MLSHFYPLASPALAALLCLRLSASFLLCLQGQKESVGGEDFSKLSGYWVSGGQSPQGTRGPNNPEGSQWVFFKHRLLPISRVPWPGCKNQSMLPAPPRAVASGCGRSGQQRVAQELVNNLNLHFTRLDSRKGGSITRLLAPYPAQPSPLQCLDTSLC